MSEGLAEALRRIAEEAELKTGALDLCALGLVSLPNELFALTHLTRLRLGTSVDEYGLRNLIPSLDGVQHLIKLTEIHFFGQPVASLEPVAGLTALQSLYCSNTQINTLEPLKGLTALQSLDCSGTQINTLEPLKGLAALQWLYCSNTQINTLEPLKGLAALQWLDCSHTSVQSLDVVVRLPNLRTLLADNLRLAATPPVELLESARDCAIYLESTRLPGVPREVLSNHLFGDCRSRLISHLHDVKAGFASSPRGKLLILGNGRAGKTQLCRRLLGDDFEHGAASTHGIVLWSMKLRRAGKAEIDLRIWDFGGQEIYHATHALFLKSRSIHLICWTPSLENTSDTSVGGVVYRNYPLPYWLDYARAAGGGAMPVLIVQTQCDAPSSDAALPKAAQEKTEELPYRRILQYSAKTNRLRATLDDALGDALDWIDAEYGLAAIGIGRLKVIEAIENLQREDAARPVDQRHHRLMSTPEFEALCQSAGGVSSTEHLLDYLHHAGIVFHDARLAPGKIILDQEWALEAIYAVLDRSRVAPFLRRSGGRFDRAMLAAAAWQAYSVGEQTVFLSMMESCGAVFRLRGRAGDPDAEYAAPELLPELEAAGKSVAAFWGDGEGAMRVITYPFAHQGFVRAIICALGDLAGAQGVYWKGGCVFYDERRRARGRIDITLADDASARIALSAKEGSAADLLSDLDEFLRRTEVSCGISREAEAVPDPARARQVGDRESADPILVPGPAPKPTTFAVSYAWNDDTPEGRDREQFVDRLCEDAMKKGVRIIRDKTDVGIRDDLVDFMDKLAASDRLFIFLSDRYLKSDNCIYEFLTAWERARSDRDLFRRTVRVFALPCAKVWNDSDRTKIAKHWRERWDDTIRNLPEEAQRSEYELDLAYRISKRRRALPEALHAIGTVIQPRRYDDFLETCFDC